MGLREALLRRESISCSLLPLDWVSLLSHSYGGIFGEFRGFFVPHFLFGFSTHRPLLILVEKSAAILFASSNVSIASMRVSEVIVMFVVISSFYRCLLNLRE